MTTKVTPTMILEDQDDADYEGGGGSPDFDVGGKRRVG